MERRSENPIINVLSGLRTNQKKSVMNMLIYLALCDCAGEMTMEEEIWLEIWLDSLELTYDSCETYLESYGPQAMETDLKALTKDQKEFLVYTSFELLKTDSDLNKTETRHFGALFERVGVSKNRVLEIINMYDPL